MKTSYKFFFIRSNKSKGWAYAPSMADLVVRAENSGHLISEVRDITGDRQGDYPDQFRF